MNFKNIKHQTNYWCRTKGIHSADLTDHPCIDDVMLLIHFRDLEQYLNTQEKNFLIGLWESTYKNKFPIKNNTMKKLENLTITVGIRQQALYEKRNLIKQRRNSNNNAKISA